jgi:hypothetical protein
MQIRARAGKLRLNILSPSHHFWIVFGPYKKGGQNEPFGRPFRVVRLFDLFESGIARLVNVGNERYRHGKDHKQVEKFKKAARELEADNSEKHFDEKLCKIAKQKPTDRPKSKGSKDRSHGVLHRRIHRGGPARSR